MSTDHLKAGGQAPGLPPARAVPVALDDVPQKVLLLGTHLGVGVHVGGAFAERGHADLRASVDEFERFQLVLGPEKGSPL